MGKMRDLSDLWGDRYRRFTTEVKQHYGFNEKCHVRYCEDRLGRCVVYVIRRSGPSRGFDHGNFAVDSSCLRWMIRQLKADNINSAYVALVEDFGGEVVTWDTARSVMDRVSTVEPYVGTNGYQYHWMDGEFELIGEARGGGAVVSEPPF